MSEAGELRAAMDAVPVLAGWAGVPERLGGLTNRVYRCGDMVLRVPGKGTEAYIDRVNEAAAARAAADAGVGPQVLHADAVTMTPDLFRTRPGAAARAGAAFARMHRSGAAFPFRFELFDMVDRYLALLAPRDVPLPEGWQAVLAEAGAVRAALARAPVPLAPCHCDPLCENFLDTGDRMWIVDWEYSGMNDPMWDLGDLSVEAGMDSTQEDAMLAAYFGGSVAAADRGRMVAYKAMCDLLWTLWGLIQLSEGNPADDFRAYADGRFARCRALMQHPDFAHHLEAIR